MTICKLYTSLLAASNITSKLTNEMQNFRYGIVTHIDLCDKETIA